MMHYMFLGIILLGMVSLQAYADNKKMPIDITSDRMEIFQDLQKTIFTGHVKVMRGTAVLGANKLDVFYGGQQNLGGDIEKVVAHDNVMIIHGENIAKGQKAIYMPNTEEVLLSGDVTLTRGENILQGESLTYDLKTGNMKLNDEKGDGRVKATFTIKGKE